MTKPDFVTLLARFPAPNWDKDIDLNKLSKTELISAISRLLIEHGKFPVPWSGHGKHSGLFVEGSDDRYIGHWMNSEGDGSGDAIMSIASEDLGNVETASMVIFQTYFAHSLSTKPNNGTSL